MPVASLQNAEIRETWINPQSLATTLLTLFIDQYADLDESDDDNEPARLECLEWDPATIRHSIEADYQTTLPDLALDKIMAAILVVTTDRFYKRLPDFITVCNVFGGSEFDPNIFDPADAVECAWGITEALLLSPPDDNDQEPFAQEIVDYIAVVVKDEAIIDPPDVLKLSGQKADIPADWSDDPAMFDAVWSRQKSRSQEIRGMLRSRLGLLITQLQSLPLRKGDTDGLVEKIQKAVPGL